jgi:outer membrane immunogenic protein
MRLFIGNFRAYCRLDMQLVLRSLAMKKFLLAGTALAALATGAQAADLGVRRVEVPSAVIAPVFNWTGFYLGGQVGYGWLNGISTFSNGAGPIGVRSSGVFGGVHVGYNYQINNFVLGLEADAELSGIRGRTSNPAVFAEGIFDLRWQGSLRARAGVAVDRALLYVTGGLAVADFRLAGGPAGGPLQGYSSTRAGWTLGAGVEYAFAPNWTGRIEYRYANYGSVSADLGPLFPGVTQRTSLQSHSVRVGVSYLFSTGPGAVTARY